MQPGELNTRITLRYPNGGMDPQTGDPFFSDGATVYAAFDVKPPIGKMIQVMDMEQPVQTRWIKIRYKAGITANWRVRCQDGQEFTINQPPINLGMKNIELFLELKAVV